MGEGVRGLPDLSGGAPAGVGKAARGISAAGGQSQARPVARAGKCDFYTRTHTYTHVHTLSLRECFHTLMSIGSLL